MYNLLSTKLLLLLVVLYVWVTLLYASCSKYHWVLDFGELTGCLCCDLWWGSWLQCSQQLGWYLFGTIHHWKYFDHLQFLYMFKLTLWFSYRSGTVNSNTVSSKFHLIRSYYEIFFYHFSNISCLKCTVNSNFHLIRSKTLLTNDFELTVPNLYYNLLHYMAYQKETSYIYAIKLSLIVLQEKSWHKIKYYLRECCTTDNGVQFFSFKKLKNDRFDGS